MGNTSTLSSAANRLAKYRCKSNKADKGLNNFTRPPKCSEDEINARIQEIVVSQGLFRPVIVRQATPEEMEEFFGNK